jgi:hypothetical protein
VPHPASTVLDPASTVLASRASEMYRHLRGRPS